MKNNNKDKKSNMIIDCYTQPIFPAHNLYVIRNPNKEEIDKLFESSDGTPLNLDVAEYSGATYSGVVEKATNEYCIIVILEADTVEECQKDLAQAVTICGHEALHAAHRVLSHADIPLDDSTGEVYAYFTGWATKCIMTTLMKNSK